MRNVDIDVMREILEEHGILVNEDIAKSITEDVIPNLIQRKSCD